MGDTSIEWTDKTWNPVTGCRKVSPGCANCYAERVFPRAYGKDRKFTDVVCHEDRLDQPLRWRKPQKIFVNSMSDLFHEDVPFAFISKVFSVMAAAEWHTFQVLTKRPDRMLQYFNEEQHALSLLAEVWPIPNIWLGVSCENQEYADRRIPLLLQTPAAVRFVSYEPALGPVDFARIQYDRLVEINALNGDHGVYRPHRGRSDSKLDWIIAGSESGPKARPADLDWYRSVRDQCQAAGVAFFFKQHNVNRKVISLPELDGKRWTEFPQ